MTTAKQIVANRHNAKASTGPKTESGKAIVARNATKHGLLSKEALLEGEAEDALVDLGMRMRAELAPVGELECLLADRIIASAWRLRRVLGVEIGIFRHEMCELVGEKGDPGLAFIRDGNGADAFSKLSRYESAIERSMYRALHELQRLQSERSGQDVPTPLVLDVELTEDVGRS